MIIKTLDHHPSAEIAVFYSLIIDLSVVFIGIYKLPMVSDVQTLKNVVGHFVFQRQIVKEQAFATQLAYPH